MCEWLCTQRTLVQQLSYYLHVSPQIYVHIKTQNVTLSEKRVLAAINSCRSEMKSLCVRVGSKSSGRCLYKGRTETRREEAMCRQRRGLEQCSHNLQDAEVRPRPSGARRKACDRCSLGASRKPISLCTWILDFRPHALWENTFLLF